MAINFVTGLPRSGKTLWTICKVKEISEKEKRPVYYCNIEEVYLKEWTRIASPDDWMTCPDGCLIVVDELQDFWGKQPPGAKVPEPILELSKHGKRGIDFYLITQEPDLVHSTPRSLCQFHYYVSRIFGMEKARIKQFSRMQLHPERVNQWLEEFIFAYPKKAFDWYKSADVHNVKRKFPLKAKLFPAAILLATGLFSWIGYDVYRGQLVKTVKISKPDLTSPSSSAGHHAVGADSGADFGSATGSVSGAKIPMSKADYLAAFIPRVSGLTHTSPRYDDLTQPVRVPVPAACVVMGNKCKCYTQDATHYPTTRDLCVQFANNGYFMDFRADPEKGDSRAVERSSGSGSGSGSGAGSVAG